MYQEEFTEESNIESQRCPTCNKKQKKCICIPSEEEYTDEQINEDIATWKNIIDSHESAELIFDYLSQSKTSYSQLFSNLSFDDVWETFFPQEFKLFQELTNQEQ